MAKKTLVIEINERAVRVCEVTKKDRGYIMGGHFAILTPEGMVTDGQLNDPEALAAVIKAGLEEHRITTKAVLFNITSGRIAMREVTIPQVKDNKVRSIIVTNAAEYFPVDLAGYHLSHTVRGTVEEEGVRRLRVMVYATPLVLVEGYFKLAQAVGLSIRSIDYMGNSLINAVRPLSDDTTTMFVSVNSATTYISFMRGNDVLLQRTLTFGGDSMVEDYLAASGRPGSDYLEALSELCDPGRTGRIGTVMDQSAIMNSLERLVSGISRSLGYFGANNHETAVERVVLYGSCGRLAYLKKAVEDSCQIPTEYLENLPGAVALLPGVSEGGLYVSAMGACAQPLDIMPPQFLTQRKKKKGAQQQSIVFGVVTLTLLTVLAGVLFFFAYNDNVAARAEKARIEQAIADLKYAEAVFDEYTLYQASLQAFVDLRVESQSPLDNLVPFLAELESKMPKAIILMSANATRENVVLNMTVPTKNDVAVVLVQLRTFESLSALRVASITENQDETGASYVNFSVVCEYGENPYFPGEGENS